MESNPRKYKFYKPITKPHKWEGKGSKGKCMLSSQFFNWDRDANLTLTQTDSREIQFICFLIYRWLHSDRGTHMKEHKGPFNHSKHGKRKIKAIQLKQRASRNCRKRTGMLCLPETVPAKKSSGFVFLQYWGSKPRVLHMLGQCSTTDLHPSPPQ